METYPEIDIIPVIIITGSVPSAVDFPKESRYHGLIQKPFDLEEVLDKVA